MTKPTSHNNKAAGGVASRGTEWVGGVEEEERGGDEVSGWQPAA